MSMPLWVKLVRMGSAAGSLRQFWDTILKVAVDSCAYVGIIAHVLRRSST